MGSAEERAGVLRQDEFEDLARHAAQTNKALRLEHLNGKLGVKPVPDGDHETIIEWLSRLCIQARTDWWLATGIGLRVEKYRGGNARPDGVLAPSGAFAGQGEWAESEGVFMAVEVTSFDSDTNRRDRVEKPAAYAAVDIPVYLLIDRQKGEVRVHSEPDGVRYQQVVTVPYGKSVLLPDPVGFELDTEDLKNWIG
ncbi:Uma2 family endonuclease [Streptomyces sulphureus]|uniref:Uma2 family endonuclease n=1 Tax=Streptomyces sulphureus TaxID=47758 RepID=UPI00037E0035|nr:Uma2 family endonuclease [Streptomyces sulphureus]